MLHTGAKPQNRLLLLVIIEVFNNELHLKMLPAIAKCDIHAEYSIQTKYPKK
jgi:hypothetical protein